jgi:hypothetical protein
MSTQVFTLADATTDATYVGPIIDLTEYGNSEWTWGMGGNPGAGSFTYEHSPDFGTTWIPDVSGLLLSANVPVFRPITFVGGWFRHTHSGMSSGTISSYLLRSSRHA